MNRKQIRALNSCLKALPEKYRPFIRTVYRSLPLCALPVFCRCLIGHPEYLRWQKNVELLDSYYENCGDDSDQYLEDLVWSHNEKSIYVQEEIRESIEEAYSLLQAIVEKHDKELLDSDLFLKFDKFISLQLSLFMAGKL